METLGQTLRRVRRAAGLSQQELAERAGLTASGISQLERGVRTRPYPHTLRALADALELDADGHRQLLDATGASGAELPRRVSLPANPDLIGRERDVSELVDRLGTSRLVTITGPGGVGKTSLATTVGHAVIDRFPGGVVFVALADVDETTAALSAIGRALGLSDRGASAIRADLRTSLGSDATLLILDNLEQLVDLGSEVAALVAEVPTLSVLATSRAPLRTADECAFPLLPLAIARPADAVPVEAGPPTIVTSDAVHLLRHRARSHGTDPAVEAAPELETICRRLDGLPLAIELVAPWLRVLTPHEIVDRLDDALPLLVAGPPDRPARHRTMRDTIRWSEMLLEPFERDLFHRLAVLPADWDLTTAAAIADRPGDDALRGIGRLVECNLVHRTADGSDGRARFRMFETVRAYAREQLDDRNELATTFERLVRVTTAFCADASDGLSSPAQAMWLASADQRLPDVRATLRWGTSGGDPNSAARCYVALMWSWYLRHTTEAEVWGRHLLGSALDERERGRVEATLALAVFARGGLEVSDELAERAAQRARRIGDAEGILRALLVSVNLAAARARPTDLDTAAAELRETAGAEPSSIAPVARAVARLAEVRTALTVADDRRAYEALAIADQEVEAAGTPWLRVLWLNVAVGCEHARGCHDGTRALLHGSIRLCLDLEDAPGLVYALAALAVDLTLEGRAAEAARVLGIGEGHSQRTGHRVTDPSILALLADARSRLAAELGAEGMAIAIRAGRHVSPDECVAS